MDRIYTLALLYRLDGDRRHLLLALEELRDALPIYRDQRWWAISRFNWNLVCNRGVGLGALAVAEDEPALASYAPDGGWAEGPDYWHYASRYAVCLPAGFQTALGHDFGLSESPGFSKTGHFRIYSIGPSGKTFSSADASEVLESAPEMFWLAQRFRQPALGPGSGARRLQPARAPIVAHRFQPDLAFVRVDLSRAYPGQVRRFEHGETGLFPLAS